MFAEAAVAATLVDWATGRPPGVGPPRRGVLVIVNVLFFDIGFNAWSVGGRIFTEFAFLAENTVALDEARIISS
uniref:Ammonium_transp domain-containing protein n=1 Tax=Angiostrongylus cantonensis TaxID=6313 RepID=A0A0K0DEH2_ANGCA